MITNVHKIRTQKAYVDGLKMFSLSSMRTASNQVISITDETRFAIDLISAQRQLLELIIMVVGQFYSLEIVNFVGDCH
jgi:hypothetical protein